MGCNFTKDDDYKMDFIDVRRAYFHADARRDVFIELPKEDPKSKDGRCVGFLKKAMNGTRDAPVEWQRVVQEALRGMGFEMSRVVPCLYYHQREGVRMIVQVDDFLRAHQRRHA